MALLTVIVIAFGLMLGFLKPRAAMSRLGGVIFGLVFFSFVTTFAVGLWSSLPLLVKLVLLLFGLPIFIGFCIRYLFGKEVYGEFMGRLLYDVFRFLLFGLIAFFSFCGRGISSLFIGVRRFARSI